MSRHSLHLALPFAALLAGSLLSLPLQAGSFAIIPQLGSAGYGAAAEWTLNDNLSISLGHTRADFNGEADSDQTHYKGDIHLRNTSLMLNWLPFGGYFRVSAGVTHQDSQLDLEQSSTSNPDLATCGPVYSHSSLPNEFAPTLTLGWTSLPRSQGLGGYFAAGAMLSGAPEVQAYGNNGPLCAAAIEDERQQVENDLSNYRVLPIVQAGLIYRL